MNELCASSILLITAQLATKRADELLSRACSPPFTFNWHDFHHQTVGGWLSSRLEARNNVKCVFNECLSLMYQLMANERRSDDENKYEKQKWLCAMEIN